MANDRTKFSETTFTRNLRYEIAGEEGRALVGSWGVAFLLGIVWLMLVWFGPITKPPSLLAEEAPPPAIEVKDLQPVEPPPAVVEAAPTRAAAAQPARGGGGGNNGRDKAIAGAFGGGNEGGVAGDVSNILRGVETNSGGGGTPGTTGGKVVLGYGQGGAGTRTPGRGGLGSGIGTGAGSGVGNVTGTGGGIGHAAVAVQAPRVVATTLGSPGRDVSELGSYVRSRQQALQFCYEEEGLKRNPNLGGTIVVAVTLTDAGSVTGVSIASRTWGGAGSSEAESCIRSKMGSWKFPPSDKGAGTYNFPFNFTH
ncbi:MAG: AgmX/PglI C-terminal domain-containing protein [Gemmatimonadaceae bacterium]